MESTATSTYPLIALVKGNTEYPDAVVMARDRGGGAGRGGVGGSKSGTGGRRRGTDGRGGGFRSRAAGEGMVVLLGGYMP